MQKAYNRTHWKDRPSDETPLNARNLDNLESGVDEIDNRVVALDTTKFNVVDAQGLIKGFSLNESTGIVTITYVNGSTQTIQTSLSKVADRLDFDPVRQALLIVHVDGTTTSVDLSAVITQNEFADSDTVDFQLNENGIVTAIVKEGSIEEKHLRPNYLAEIKIESGKAESSAESASISAKLSENYYEKTKETGDNAIETINNAIDNINQGVPKFYLNPIDGKLYHTPSRFTFVVNRATGQLEWGVTI